MTWAPVCALRGIVRPQSELSVNRKQFGSNDLPFWLAIGPCSRSLIHDRITHHRVVSGLTALYPKLWKSLRFEGLGTAPRELGGLGLPQKSWTHFKDNLIKGCLAGLVRQWRYATSTIDLTSLSGPWNYNPSSAGVRFILRRLIPSESNSILVRMNLRLD